MPQAEGGLVTSFLDTMQGLTQMQRQKSLDRENAIQTAVQNAMQEHNLLLREQEVKNTQEHYKALETQAQAAEQLRQQQEDRRARQAQWMQARDQARLEIARIAQQQRSGLTIEKSRLALMNFLIRQGYDPKAPEFQQTLDAVTGEFWTSTGLTAPKQPMQPLTLDGAPQIDVSKIGVSPLAHEHLLDLEARRKQTQTLTADMHTFHEAQAVKLAADAAYTKAREDLTKSQQELAWKKFGLDTAKFQFDKLYKNNELDLRRFSEQTQRIRAQLEANKTDMEAQKERDGLVKWATSYKEAAQKARSAAGLKVDKARDALARAQATIAGINKLPKEQQAAQASVLLQAQGVVAGTAPQIKNLEADFNAAQQQYTEANQALYEVKQINQKKVTPSGTVVPYAPKSVVPLLKGTGRPSPPDAGTVKALERSEQRHRTVRPRPTGQAEKVGNQAYKVVTTVAAARALKPGTPYLYRERGKPDRYMIR